MQMVRLKKEKMEMLSKKTENKEFEKMRKELESIKLLLALHLKNSDVKGDLIAKAMGISEGRLSQLLPQKNIKNKRM